jgi:AcrR family transcriptional regulator
MKKVSREARVSQGILHYYFADKRAILVAALGAVMDDLDARVRAAQARSGPDAAARLRALIEASLRTALEAREVWVVFVEFWGEMMHDDRLRAINAGLYTRMRRLIGALIRQGTRRGQFRPVEPTRAAAVILGLLDGVALQLTFDPEAFDVATATRFCQEALGRYLAR